MATVKSETVCTNCGLTKHRWPVPAGIKKNDKIYCCKECAESRSCGCNSDKKGRKADFMEDTRPSES